MNRIGLMSQLGSLVGILVGIIVCCLTNVALAEDPSPLAEPSRVLIIVGPSNHPPGTHEVAAGARLLAHCLQTAEGIAPLTVEVLEGWPSDKDVLKNVDSVVFSGDRFPLAELDRTDQNMQELAAMMEAGCGIVCFHYATGLTVGQVPPDGDHPLLKWMGGYFATRCLHHQSIARIFPQATITPHAVEHPVMRGVKPFTVHDEPYINNYFGPNGMAPNVTALATSMLPPEDPHEEVIAWAVERDNGGRGMAIVMPHFYKNWEVDDLRKIILNGVVWSCHREVPPQGVDVELPPLSTFKPTSIEPQPRIAK